MKEQSANNFKIMITHFSYLSLIYFFVLFCICIIGQTKEKKYSDCINNLIFGFSLEKIIPSKSVKKKIKKQTDLKRLASFVDLLFVKLRCIFYPIGMES